MKILVVKLHALGDLVIATPALRWLRDGLPSAQIELLTTNWTEPAIRHSDLVNEVISVPHSWFFEKRLSSATNIMALAGRLRLKRYDAAVVFHQSKMINAFVSASVSGEKVRFAEGDSENCVHLADYRHSALTAVDLSRLAITKLGGEVQPTPGLQDLKYEWVVDPVEMEMAEKIMREQNLIPKKFVAIFPGGGSNPSTSAPERRWRPEGFSELIKWIQAQGLRPVLMGGETDRIVCREVNDIAGREAIDLCGEMPVRVAAAMIAESALNISNDSAPMHISAAVGAPTLGIFGPTGAHRKLPPGENSASVSLGLPCSPCYFGVFKGCLFDSIRCMEELETERVISAAGKLLEQGLETR